MRRYQLGLLAFCLLLLLGIGLLSAWLGRAAAVMVVDGEQRGAPYYFMQWLPRSPGARGTDTNPHADYREALVAVAAVDGGSLLWSAAPLRRAERRTRRGSSREVLASFDVFEFAAGIGLVQMLTNSDFRALDSELSVEPLRAGTVSAPRDLDPTKPALLMLYEDLSAEARSGDSPTTLNDVNGRGWLRALPAHQGTISWQGDLTWWGTQANWNRFFVLQFATPEGLEAWLRDPATRAGRALVSRDLGDFVILRLPAPSVGGYDEKTGLPDTRRTRPDSAM